MANNEGYVLLEEGLRLHYRTVGAGPDTVVIPAAAGLAADLESRLFGISRGKATYGSTPIKRTGDSPQGPGKGVEIEL